MNNDPFNDPNLVSPAEAELQKAVEPFDDKNVSDKVVAIHLAETEPISGTFEIEYVGDDAQKVTDEAAFKAAQAAQRPDDAGQAGSR